MSDINIEASFSDGEFATKHIAFRVGFLRCRHLAKQVIATQVSMKCFDSLDIHNKSNIFMFLNAIRYKTSKKAGTLLRNDHKLKRIYQRLVPVKVLYDKR